VDDQQTDTRDLLDARDEDPKLSVHVLSEFVFCGRAGLCLHEQDDEYEERDDDADVSYFPLHERDELERLFKTLSTQVWGSLLAGVVGFIGCGAVAVGTGQGVFWAAAGLAGFAFFLVAVDRCYWAWDAARHLRVWRMARGQMPDPDSARIQEVSWCELRAAGFTTREPEAYTYEPWKLGGRPWKVLEYGDLRIPVFMYYRKWKGLYPQHFARMTAYCELIEKCEGYRSPYGVILHIADLNALIVPKTARSEETFRNAVLQAREAIRAADEMNVFPPSPSEASVCRDCHLGKPQVYGWGEPFSRHGDQLMANPVRGHTWRQFHSHCGDRFRWIAPHRKALQLGLRPYEDTE
jgi:hypothetical protein